MKKDILHISLIFSLLSLVLNIQAQIFPMLVEPVQTTQNEVSPTCGSDRLNHKHAEENPQFAKDLEHFKNVVIPHLASVNSNAENGNILTIPTVVHIIHEGEPIGQGQNLAEERVLGQIAIMNEDFAALNPEFDNTPSQWQSVRGTPNIQFCLATVDPDGNATDGINRVQMTVTGTNWQNNNIESEIKPAVNWNPNLYLNIYVLPIPGTTANGGVVGYSNYPTVFEIGSDGDGPVVDYRWFGAPGFGQSGYRAIIHELGHYLGLPHPFDGNSCNQDDGISDTPNVNEATSTLANLNCSNTYPTGPMSCGNEHMYVNYMDYTNENCYTSFTEEQVNIMRAVLDGTSMGLGYGSRKPLVDNSAIACILNEHDAGILEVLEPTGRICDNDPITPIVKLRNFGTEPLNSVFISWQVDSNDPDTLIWMGTLNSGSNEDITLNGFTPPPGNFDFKVYTFLPNNMADERIANDTVTVNLTAFIPMPVPVIEDLEGETAFPTMDGFFRLNINPPLDGFQWLIAGGISGFGVGQQSLFFNNFDGNGDNNPFGTTDAMISPHYDLSGSSGTQLTFDVAYTNFDETFSDTLLIFAALDCSSNFDQLLYVKGGEELATAPPSDTFWFPNSTEWRTETIDLSMYDGVEDITLAFVNFSGWGNNIFLDNINVGPPCALTFTTESAAAICNGDCNGTATVNVPSGDNLTYEWDNGQTGQTATGLCAGDYEVTISDGNGCDAVATVTVEEPDELTTGVSWTNESANNENDGTIMVSPNGGNPGYSYNWSDGQTGQTATDLAPGTYSVTITDDKGCQTTASATVSEYDCSGFSVSTSTTSVSCFGEDDGSALAVPAGSFGPYIYNWSTGDTDEQAFGLTAGTYTVTVSDGFNCPFMVDATVTQPDELTIDATATGETANGAGDGTATVTFDGGTDPITAEWSNGHSGTTIMGLWPGNYTVTITDNNDCTATTSVTVNSFDCGAFNAGISGTDISCFGENDGTASVTGVMGTAPFNYNWSNGLNDQNLTNLPPGNYSVTVSDASDCASVLAIVISEPSELIPTLSKTDEMTNSGNDGSASVSPSGGTMPYEYSWSTGAMTNSISNLSPGNYSVTVTDANDCEWTESFVIAPFDCSISGSLNIMNASCPNSMDGTAMISVIGGTGPFDITWSNGDTGPTADMLSPGFYIVTVMDVNECDFMQTFQIMGFDTEAPIVIVDEILTVSLNALGEASITAQDVDDGTFDNCGIESMTISQSDFDCDDIGDNTIVFTAVDENGNQNQGIVTITVSDKLPPVLISCPDNISVFDCEEVITYDLPVAEDNCGNLTMELVSGLGSGSLFPVGTTTETYLFTDAGGNKIECSFDVTLDYDLEISFDVEEPTCAGFSDGNIFINATGGTAPYQFQFSNGGDPVNLSAGTYSATLTDSQGCIIIENVEVGEPNPLVLDIGNVTDAVNGSGGMIEFFPGGGTGSLEINFYLDGVLIPDADPQDLAPGDYVIEIIDENNCTVESDVVTVENMVGVNDLKYENLIKIFPNPTNGEVFVRLELPHTAWVSMNVLDVNGKEILPVSGEMTSENTFRLDLKDLNSGVYLIRILIDEEVVTKRVVVFD